MDRLHWIIQVIAFLMGLLGSGFIAFYAGRVDQPISYLVMVVILISCMLMLIKRYHDNPFGK